MSGVVYIVMSAGPLLESVWTDPDDALDAKDKLGRHARAYVVVRPINSKHRTPESRAALIALRARELERTQS